MIYDKESIIELILNLCRAEMDKKRFGEFGFTVTMHEGQPVKITEISTQNFIRRPSGCLQISK